MQCKQPAACADAIRDVMQDRAGQGFNGVRDPRFLLTTAAGQAPAKPSPQRAFSSAAAATISCGERRPLWPLWPLWTARPTAAPPLNIAEINKRTAVFSMSLKPKVIINRPTARSPTACRAITNQTLPRYMHTHTHARTHTRTPCLPPTSDDVVAIVFANRQIFIDQYDLNYRHDYDYCL